VTLMDGVPLADQSHRISRVQDGLVRVLTVGGTFTGDGPRVSTPRNSLLSIGSFLGSFTNEQVELLLLMMKSSPPFHLR
jgi:hypothetical protein